MLLDHDVVLSLVRANSFDELHQLLNKEMEGASVERRHSIAHWRTHALVREKRLEDAIDHLRKNREDFLCKTSAYAEAAELLDLLGRNAEAQAELAGAPIIEEQDDYPVLVKDAKFIHLIIKIRGGYRPSDAEINAFPDDFGTVILPGRPFLKSDLIAMIKDQI